jgi:hypothetical protein
MSYLLLLATVLCLPTNTKGGGTEQGSNSGVRAKIHNIPKPYHYTIATFQITLS